MTKKDVKINSIYVAKISGKLTYVKILSENPISGWNAENIKTGRIVRIRSGAKLRSEAKIDFALLESHLNKTKTGEISVVVGEK